MGKKNKTEKKDWIISIDDLEKGLKEFIERVGMDLAYFNALDFKKKKTTDEKIKTLHEFLKEFDAIRTLNNKEFDKQLRATLGRKNLKKINWSTIYGKKIEGFYTKLAKETGSHKKKNGKRSDALVVATKIMHILSDGKLPMLDNLVSSSLKDPDITIKKGIERGAESCWNFKEKCDELMQKKLQNKSYEQILRQELKRAYYNKVEKMWHRFEKITRYRLLDMALWALAKDQEKKQKDRGD